jgi:hypothetical protein
MGMIADLDGPQFVAERRGPQVPGTSSPRPSPPLRVEERVSEGRERRRSGSEAQLEPRSARRAPGAVCVLWCQPTRAGGLMFAWQRPPGGEPVAGYRLERTRDGRAYETLEETARECCTLPPVDFNDGWFYRITACNARGTGPARWVIYYLRRQRDSILQRVPVRSGLRVNICELVRQEEQMGTREARSSIARDTPLVPRAAAEAVWEEACRLLAEELPHDWIGLLTERAETIYQRRGNYHRRLRGAGDTGRDWLWAFLRHWLAALVLRHHSDWYRRLPAGYAIGLARE